MWLTRAHLSGKAECTTAEKASLLPAELELRCSPSAPLPYSTYEESAIMADCGQSLAERR
jgi:hypothetical protein